MSVTRLVDAKISHDGHCSMVSGPWPLASGPLSLGFCLWSLVSGPWSLASGPVYLVSGHWSLVYDPWPLVSGPLSLVSGPWSLVSGPWSLVYGVRCPWSLVPGIWHLVPCPLYMAPGLWFLVLGAVRINRWAVAQITAQTRKLNVHVQPQLQLIGHRIRMPVEPTR